jgi:3-isopropylmalate/(R)-2-methylmalate dehydratase large subunit
MCVVAGGKTEDFLSAAKLFYRAKRQVKVPTYLVPATQKVRRKVVGISTYMQYRA